MPQIYINSKIILLCWLLAAVVLSDVYTGENIGKLSAPLAPHRINDFSQLTLHNFTAYSPVASHYRLFSSDYHSDLKGNWKQYMQLSAYYGDLEDQLMRNMWVPQTNDEINDALDNEYFVRKLDKCKDTVFVAEFPDASGVYLGLRRLLSKANRSELEYLTLSKTTLWLTRWKMKFYNFPIPAATLSVWLYRLMDSGLLQFWSKWDFLLRDWQFKVESGKQSSNQPFQISMRSNISVLFLLGAGLLFGLAAPAFIIECAYCRLKIYKRFLNLSFAKSYRNCVHQFKFQSFSFTKLCKR